jgi:hypothetical protein
MRSFIICSYSSHNSVRMIKTKKGETGGTLTTYREMINGYKTNSSYETTNVAMAWLLVTFPNIKIDTQCTELPQKLWIHSLVILTDDKALSLSAFRNLRKSFKIYENFFLSWGNSDTIFLFLILIIICFFSFVFFLICSPRIGSLSASVESF